MTSLHDLGTFDNVVGKATPRLRAAVVVFLSIDEPDDSFVMTANIVLFRLKELVVQAHSNARVDV